MKGFLGSGSATPNGSGGSSSKSASVDTLIGRQTEVLGDVRFAGGLHVDGKVKGAVITTGDKTAALSVSETGAIEGDVHVPNIMLNGSVTGDVHSSERLQVAAKAKITGNVHYRVLQMEPGAKINGLLHYEDGNESVQALSHLDNEVPGSTSVVDLEDGSRMSRIGRD